MDIVLQTHDRDALLMFQTLQPYSTYSGFAARVSVRSGQFAGEAIVSSRPDQFQRFLADLDSMDRLLRGSARFESDYEDHYVELSVGSTGTVVVAGTLFYYAELSQQLQFAFRTDQTSLRPLVNELKAFSNMAAT